MSTNTLHFSFGPVQGFVSQSRRTRDLWAGSYLLSYLAGQAMAVVKTNGGEIVFPQVDNDPLFQGITGGPKKPFRPSDPAASLGSLPNRFKAEVPESFDPGKCADAIRGKWQEIADGVKAELDAVLKSASAAIDSDIWTRQIEHHWDCAWAFGEDDALLDIRKNLRTHLPPPEGGEKCTVCGERQEVSGKGMGTGTSRKEMGVWWGTLRDELVKLQKATLFDLKEGERLCAVCLLKRAYPFPAIAKEVIGWEVPVNYPSTSYMAAVDWIIRVFEACKDDPKVQNAVEGYLDAAEKAHVWHAEAATRIEGISTAGAASGLAPDHWQTFADLDGDAFFKSAIRNPREFEIAGDDPKDPEKSRANPNREKLLITLDALQKTLPEKSGLVCEATPFYALLLMDGDGMGKLLSSYKTRQEDIAKAVARFTQAVPDIIKDCNGRLIYAGGDDVFALLPLDRAIECAKSCRKAYTSAFQDIFGRSRQQGDKVPKQHETTISAAIEYAHMQTALSVVVRDAHRLLDEVAKEQCGRDGLACRVWKRGGPVLTWTQPWAVVLDVKTTGGISHATLLDEVKYMFQDASQDAGKFSSKYFYKLRELFDLVASDGAIALDEVAAKKILATEYLSNRDLAWPPSWTEAQKLTAAEERVDLLFVLCCGRRRTGQNGAIDPHYQRHSADGSLLVRFLSQKEV